jgi:hypothetical protein
MASIEDKPFRFMDVRKHAYKLQAETKSDLILRH